MKKIITSVMVLALVGSALAFTEKKAGTFCVSLTGQANQSCTVVNRIKIIDPGTPNTFYKANWNGDPLTCTTCPTPIEVQPD